MCFMYCVSSFLFFISNGRYIDGLSLTDATNEGKKVKWHYKYYIKKWKT
jgi:hypothetical protein